MKPLRLSLSSVPDHGFDEPLGLLSDCHRRIEYFLQAMLAVARAARGGDLDAANRDLLERAIRYFATAAPRHTADEETSLFPRLRASSDPRALAALETLQALEADHRAAEERHREVDRLARRWMAESHLEAAETEALIWHLEALSVAYERHIAIEDRELFPAASGILSAGDLEAVGREMADRRGVPFRAPGTVRLP